MLYNQDLKKEIFKDIKNVFDQSWQAFSKEDGMHTSCNHKLGYITFSNSMTDERK